MKIREVEYDSFKVDGCPTCDFGSTYINDIRIIFEDEWYLKFYCERLDDYALTEGDWFVILGNSRTREDIINKWRDKVDKYAPGESIYYEQGYLWSNESRRTYLTAPSKDYD